MYEGRIFITHMKLGVAQSAIEDSENKNTPHLY